MKQRNLDDLNTLWQFTTARYTVAFWAEGEDTAPEDLMCFDEDIAFAREDEPAHWFCAFVGVFDEQGDMLGCDILGGCSYRSFTEFLGNRTGWRKGERIEPGSYLPGMVREAIREARGAVALASEGARRA